METRICLNCGKEFSRKKRVSLFNWNKVKYCSKECRYLSGTWGKYWSGKHLSKEHKDKISRNINNIKVQFKKGNIPYNKIGDGITKENELDRKSDKYKDWRDKVLIRDNYTCQRCGQFNGTINTHHIQNFSKYKELRFEIDNGITLCEKCHKEFHKKYGFKNNDIEQLEEFINNYFGRKTNQTLD